MAPDLRRPSSRSPLASRGFVAGENGVDWVRRRMEFNKEAMFSGSYPQPACDGNGVRPRGDACQLQVDAAAERGRRDPGKGRGVRTAGPVHPPSAPLQARPLPSVSRPRRECGIPRCAGERDSRNETRGRLFVRRASKDAVHPRDVHSDPSADTLVIRDALSRTPSIVIDNGPSGDRLHPRGDRGQSRFPASQQPAACGRSSPSAGVRCVEVVAGHYSSSTTAKPVSARTRRPLEPGVLARTSGRPMPRLWLRLAEAMLPSPCEERGVGESRISERSLLDGSEEMRTG